MSDQIIPLSPGLNQSMTITLSVDNQNIVLGLTFTYNSPGGYWWMMIEDSNGNTLLDAVPLVTGDYPAANLLEQYSYLNIGSAYIVPIGQVQGIPDETNLGTDFVLVWSDTTG